jgi:hypothetical protein
MKIMSRVALAALSVTAFSAVAQAAPFIYFGENQNPGGGVSGDPVTARASFLSALSGVNTEDFESLPAGQTPSTVLAFTGTNGTINATLTGGGAINNFPNTGAYATSGVQYYDNQFNAYTISFSSAVAAFGFYGTDIGDVGEALTVVLGYANGGSATLTVPNTVNGNNGSLLFYGIIDTANPFTSVTFNQSGADRFGFDDLTIGDVGQVTNPPAVPEPATWAMMLTGFGLVGAAARRRKAALPAA